MGIDTFDVDAANFDPYTVKTYTRPDRAAAMRQTHEAAEYDRWFRAQVAEAVKEGDDPKTQWVTQDDAKSSWSKKRAAFSKRVARVKA